MFDKSIIETDNFLNMSMSAKALYFLLGMEADDEGFVSPKRVMRLYGGEVGDAQNLVDAGLIIPFRSGVVVITDWNQNNWLDNRRIRPTQYQLEKKQLILTSQKKYELSNGLAVAQLVESREEEIRVEKKRGEGEDKTTTAIKKQNTDTIATATELEVKQFELHWAMILKGVPNYPFNREKDLAHFLVLLKNFPNVRLRKVLDKWALQKKTTKPIISRSNPRQEINNWVARAKGDELINP